MTDQTTAAVIDRLRAMHKPRTERPNSGCVQCGIVWPCPTSRVLDGAPAVVVPPADRAALVAQAAQAIRDSNGSPEALAWWEQHPQLIPAHVYAAAVLAVLPAPADRATVLAEAADKLDAYIARYRAPSIANWTGAVAFLRRLAAEARETETQPANRSAVLLDIATELDQLAETDVIRKRRSLATARRLLAVELRKMADADQPAVSPVVADTGTEAARLGISCPEAFWSHTPHQPHEWQHSPGKDPARCPGYPASQ